MEGIRPSGTVDVFTRTEQLAVGRTDVSAERDHHRRCAYLTEAAAAKAKALLDQDDRDDLSAHRRAAGGCAGLVPAPFDDRSLDVDLTVDFGGVTLAVDRMSAPDVQGASIDFVDTIEKQGFTIDNPNATGSCACGDSFN